MKRCGVVAAGSKGTAAVGAEILRSGGTAVDAACGACFATSAFEPALTSLAGGGLMLVKEGATGQAHVVDFLCNVPGIGAPASHERDFFPIEVDFGSAQQIFHVGRAAAAVPGTLLGLSTALERFGRLPLSAIVAPAVRHLRQGNPLDDFQAFTFRLLRPILTHDAATRSVFAPRDKLLGAGDEFIHPALADTLEELGAEGVEPYFSRVFTPALLKEFGPDAGGQITAADIEQYRVMVREPLQRVYRHARLLTVPSPSHGGLAVAAMLSLLEDVDFAKLARGGPGHVSALAGAMVVSDAMRQQGDHPLLEGGLDDWKRRFSSLSSPGTRRSGLGSTTHISVMDGEGNAASVTLSYGEGCGYMMGKSGIELNNFMGEEDLHPDGFHKAPAGQRLPSNMCPSAVVHDNWTCVLGSGGANRIRSAITQVIVNLVDYGLSPEEAVATARVHLEDGVLNAELHGGIESDALASLGSRTEKIVKFQEPNLFFGGVHLAMRDRDGAFLGGGDPRRNGAVIVVE